MRLAMCVLTFAVFLSAMVAPVPVKLVDEGGVERSQELYLGDKVYVVVDLRNFPPAEFKMRISLLAGGFVLYSVENSTLGYTVIFGGPVVIDRVVEGQVYTFRVDLFTPNGTLVGRGTQDVRIKYCPDLTIDKFSARVQYGGGSAVSFLLKSAGEGRSIYSYVVRIYSRESVVRPVELEVRMAPNQVRNITVPLELIGYRPSDTLIVSVLCAGGAKEALRYSERVNIVTAVAPLQLAARAPPARLNATAQVFLAVVNTLPFDIEVLGVALSGMKFRDLSVNYPRLVRGGGSANITLGFVPLEGGRFNTTVVLSYRIPATGERLNLTVSVPVDVYLSLKVVGLAPSGSLHVRFRVNGTVVESGGEVQVLPGVYRVEVLNGSVVSEGAKWLFSGWSDGVRSATRYISVSSNAVLYANYSAWYLLQFRILGNISSLWVPHGGVVSLSAPAVQDLGGGRRLRFVGWSDGSMDTTRVLAMDQPRNLTAIYLPEYLVLVRLLNQTVAAWVREGGVYNFSAPMYISGGERVRYRFVRWSTGSTAPSLSFRVGGPLNLTAEYTKEYLVRVYYAVKNALGVKEGDQIDELWAREGEVLDLSRYIERYEPKGGEGEKYKLKILINGVDVNESAVKLLSPVDVQLVWTKYLFIDVYTNVGSARGGGWYLEGSTAVISIENTEYGFLIKDRFSRWVDKYGNVYFTPSITITVDRPNVYTAVWEKDYGGVMLLGIGSGSSVLMFLYRGKIVPVISKILTRKHREEEETKVYSRRYIPVRRIDDDQTQAGEKEGD